MTIQVTTPSEGGAAMWEASEDGGEWEGVLEDRGVTEPNFLLFGPFFESFSQIDPWWKEF